jgi:hypothetical protein
MVLILILSQIFFYYFLYEVNLEIQFNRKSIKYLIGLCFAINFTIIFYTLVYFLIEEFYI